MKNIVFNTITLLAMMMIIITGCAMRKVIDYKPSETMSIKDASEVVEELIMTQHRAWRPNYLKIYDKYMLWGYGSASVSHENFAGNYHTKTQNVGERVYYKSIKNIRLHSRNRNFKKWYVVSIIGNDNIPKKYVLYTRDINEAKRFFDAFQSLITLLKK